jgi:hypothetical protein
MVSPLMNTANVFVMVPPEMPDARNALLQEPNPIRTALVLWSILARFRNVNQITSLTNITVNVNVNDKNALVISSLMKVVVIANVV